MQDGEEAGVDWIVDDGVWSKSFDSLIAFVLTRPLDGQTILAIISQVRKLRHKEMNNAFNALALFFLLLGQNP